MEGILDPSFRTEKLMIGVLACCLAPLKNVVNLLAAPSVCSVFKVVGLHT